VYCHTSPSGKQYIGWTSRSLWVRWVEHVSDARLGGTSAFHCAIRKYGPDAFRHEVLALADSPRAAVALEREWVARRKTGTPRGYNRTLGGEGGHFTAEFRGIMSRQHAGKKRTLSAEAMAAESRRRWSDPVCRSRMRGWKHTPESIAKMKAARRALAQDPCHKARLSEGQRRRHARARFVRGAKLAWLAVEAAFQ
jgi:hypothetical protein